MANAKKKIEDTAAVVAEKAKKTAAKVADKPAVKKAAKATSTAAKKATGAAKKTAEKVTTKVNTYVEFAGKQISAEEIADKVRADYKAKNSKARIKTIEIYVKPEDNAAYYVVNGKADENNKVDL